MGDGASGRTAWFRPWPTHARADSEPGLAVGRYPSPWVQLQRMPCHRAIGAHSGGGQLRQWPGVQDAGASAGNACRKCMRTVLHDDRTIKNHGTCHARPPLHACTLAARQVGHRAGAQRRGAPVGAACRPGGTACPAPPRRLRQILASPTGMSAPPQHLRVMQTCLHSKLFTVTFTFARCLQSSPASKQAAAEQRSVW